MEVKISKVNWTMEDLMEIYNTTLKFPDKDFNSSDFWHSLIEQKSIFTKNPKINEHDILTLWSKIMKETHGNLQLFQSLMNDYSTTLLKDKLLTEKIQKVLTDMFLSEKPFTPLNYVPNIPEQAESLILASKREQSEPNENIFPGENQGNCEFIVQTQERYPKIDLRELKNNENLQGINFEELDLKIFENIGKNENKFMENFGNVKLRKLPLNLVKIKINLKPIKTDSEKKLEMMRRELKILQNCFGKNTKEISNLYVRTSGDFNKMRSYLKGEQVILWDDQEDSILKTSKNSSEYQKLYITKGENEVKKRKKFLEISNDI